jgi:uncharacterized sulfatase
MTGKYPARIHLTDFIAGNANNSYPLQQPEWQKFLPLEEKTIGELFQENGYNTALFGKWHLSPEKIPPASLPYNPDQQGFNEHFVTYKPSPGLAKPWQTPEIDGHNVDTLTNLALDFLERNQDKQFFLMVSHNTIHDPLMEDSTRVAAYRAKTSGNPANNPVIGAMINKLDESTGKILKKLDELKLSEKTIVIFYSDNGGKHAYADQEPWRKGKGWLYEGGIRVPLVIRWPGKITPGSESEAMVSSIDFYPTFAEILGQNSAGTDGISLLSHWQNSESDVRSELYWHYPHYHGGSGMVPGAAIRSGNYKLVEWFEPELTGEEKFLELYNLADDPGETHDLAEDLPEITRDLHQKLVSWRNEIGAQMPVVNPDL